MAAAQITALALVDHSLPNRRFTWPQRPRPTSAELCQGAVVRWSERRPRTPTGVPPPVGALHAMAPVAAFVSRAECLRLRLATRFVGHVPHLATRFVGHVPHLVAHRCPNDRLDLRGAERRPRLDLHRAERRSRLVACMPAWLPAWILAWMPASWGWYPLRCGNRAPAGRAVMHRSCITVGGVGGPRRDVMDDLTLDGTLTLDELDLPGQIARGACAHSLTDISDCRRARMDRGRPVGRQARPLLPWRRPVGRLAAQRVLIWQGSRPWKALLARLAGWVRGAGWRPWRCMHRLV